jgi:hypothetical protein
MTEPLPFLLAVLALLALPGPTNALLAASSAVAGWRRSLPLVVVAVLGYTATVLVIGFSLGQLAQVVPLVGLGLRIASLLMSRVWPGMSRVWPGSCGGRCLIPVGTLRSPSVTSSSRRNPKALILALRSSPTWALGVSRRCLTSSHWLSRLPVALLWLMLGAAVRKGTRLAPLTLRRVSTARLATLTLGLVGSILGGIA